MAGLDDDVVQEYLAECLEHLNGIESELLLMEQDGAEVDDLRVNKVFRAAHSIKGGAGFFDFNNIRNLAHKTENVLDLIRSRRLVASSGVVNALLLAFDRLREMIGDPAASEHADLSAILSGLESLTISSLPAESQDLPRRPIEIRTGAKQARVSATEFDFDAARKSGQKIYLIEYDLLHDVQRKGKTPLEVMKSLMMYGRLLDTAFDLDSAGTLDDEPSNSLILQVLYATCVDTDLIEMATGGVRERIWKVDRGGVCGSICDDAPESVVEEPCKAPAAPAQQPAAIVEPQIAKTAVEAPATSAADSSSAANAPAAAASNAETTVRLHVTLLDSLMNLAGELVLCRNQLSDAVARRDQAMIQAASQSISVVTSDVQQTVMRTRMQPVGNLFQKFTRFVRDAGRKLGKQVRLVIEANDVELDKTIIEGLSDPLSHMVRNAVDHGLEPAEARAAAGKPAEGAVFLRAWHEAGLVVVEIADDGRGLDAEKLAASALKKGLISAETARTMSAEEKLDLIFLPGFSTAERVSDLSGRGVGMDVVKTNLDRLGGKLEIQSQPGLGSSFRVKLPLTLAIIPSLLVSAGEERLAIPLGNVQKLIRIAPEDIAGRIESVGNARVLALQDALVPLIDLSAALGVDGDARGNGPSPTGAAAAMSIVLLSAGAYRYGLIVERLHETMEIVVKPLGRRLKHLRQYAGATILGDGCVALILDAAGVASVDGLLTDTVSRQIGETARSGAADTHQLLLFHNSPEEACALPLHVVARVEKIRPSQVEVVAGRRSMQYRGRGLPLATLADTAQVAALPLDDRLVVVVLETARGTLGLLAAQPVDVIEADLNVDPLAARQAGVIGSAIVRGRTTLVLDSFELAEAALPERAGEGRKDAETARKTTVLVVEDSGCLRQQTASQLAGAGFTVLTAADGEEGWQTLEARGAEIQLVVTDVDMPRLDGLQLTRRIRSDRRRACLPVIMLTSLGGEEDVKRGKAAGATAYCLKLDRDRLLDTVREVMANAVPSVRGESAGLGELARHVSEITGHAAPCLTAKGETK